MFEANSNSHVEFDLSPQENTQANNIEECLLENTESKCFRSCEPSSYKTRSCTKYIHDPEQNACKRCHNAVSLHDQSDAITTLEPTNAHGILTFPGFKAKRASYIRVGNMTKAADLLNFMFCPKRWHMEKPKLIIRVIGGALNFNIPYRVKLAFKRGLIRAATSSDAWIITGGRNAGVMRLVGEAVTDDCVTEHNTKLVVLGIVMWGDTAMQNKLTFESNSQEPHEVFYANDNDQTSPNKNFLDQNHTHFILVDDGPENFWEDNEPRNPCSQLRNELENELRRGNIGQHAANCAKSSTVPIVLVVVQGRNGTLISIKDALQQNPPLPILVFAGSGGCADLIVEACKHYNTEDECIWSKLVEESGIYDKEKSALNEMKLQKAAQRLRFIVEKKAHITVFCLRETSDAKKDARDFEQAIFNTVLGQIKDPVKCHFEKLNLTLNWNRDDIAKKYVFTGKEDFRQCELVELMDTALVYNRPRFVELILEKGLNLKQYLPMERLLSLYNSGKIRELERKAPLFKLIKSTGFSQLDGTNGSITFQVLNRFLKRFSFDDLEAQFLDRIILVEKALQNKSLDKNSHDYKDKSLIKDPEQNLFIWSLLLNRTEMAHIFWKIGKYHICNALFASQLLKRMAKRDKDLEIVLQQRASEYEDMACGVLRVFDSKTENWLNCVLLLQNIPYYGINCLTMANQTDCLRFISLPAVQDILDRIWLGRCVIQPGVSGKIKLLLSLCTGGLLEPSFQFPSEPKPAQSAVTFSNRSSDESKDHPENKKVLAKYFLDTETKPTCMSRMKQFLQKSPIVTFSYDAALKIVFLILFSYTLLCQMSFKSTEFTNSIEAIRKENNKLDAIRHFSWYELTLFAWIVALLLGEITQCYNSHPGTWFNYKCFRYYKSAWNVLDVLGIGIYFFGFSLRCVPIIIYIFPILDRYVNSYDCFIAARLFLCIDLLVWYIRSMHILIPYKSLGAKIYMIMKMFAQMRYFALVFPIFIIGHGVVTQAALYSTNTSGIGLLRSIFDKGYWPMFGELKVVDEWKDRKEYLDTLNCERFADMLIDYGGKISCLEQVQLNQSKAWKEKSRELLSRMDCSQNVMILTNCVNSFQYSNNLNQTELQMASDGLVNYLTPIGNTSNGTTCSGSVAFLIDYLNSTDIEQMCGQLMRPIVSHLALTTDSMLIVEHSAFWNNLRKPTGAELTVGYILIAFYMFVGNIILINLLIAMFAYIFEEIQENSNQIWCKLRYQFVFEYYETNWPPPLNIMQWIIRFVVWVYQLCWKLIRRLNNSLNGVHAMNQHSVPIWDSRSDSSDQRSGQGRRAARADQIHPNHRDDVWLAIVHFNGVAPEKGLSEVPSKTVLQERRYAEDYMRRKSLTDFTKQD